MPQQAHFEQMITNEIPYDDEEMVRLAQPEMLQQLKETADVYASSDKGEMLRYHYRFGHLPYNNKLKQMAREGIIPRQLANIEPPKCAACMFGKLTKRAWRSKAKPKTLFVAKQPGQCISVD